MTLVAQCGDGCVVAFATHAGLTFYMGVHAGCSSAENAGDALHKLYTRFATVSTSKLPRPSHGVALVERPTRFGDFSFEVRVGGVLLLSSEHYCNYCNLLSAVRWKIKVLSR